jgi:hypothetical protein
MMMVTVMVMAVNNHHDLCLRRIRDCEAEDENQTEQNLFHSPSMARSKVMRRATLTSAYTPANAAPRKAAYGSFDTESLCASGPCVRVSSVARKV